MARDSSEDLAVGADEERREAVAELVARRGHLSAGMGALAMDKQ